jgi:hypothetical protein
MPDSRFVALLISRLKVAAWRGTLRVDSACDLSSNRASQRLATRGWPIGAGHAAVKGIHLLG